MGIRNTEVLRYWPALEPYIELALSYSLGEYEACDVLAALEAGRMQAWAVAQDGDLLCVVVTEVIRYPRRIVVNLLFGAGEQMTAWRPLIETLKAWALERGAHEVRVIGRPGWERALSNFGFVKAYTVLTCPITGNMQ